MHLIVLAVPDCPSVLLLNQRLAQVLEGRSDVTISHRVVDDPDQEARRGMHGSPTLLVDGIDPFAEPGQPASVSCRLYRNGGKAEGAPSVGQLRQAISWPVTAVADTGDGAGGVRPAGRLLPAEDRVRSARPGPDELENSARLQALNIGLKFLCESSQG